MPRDLPTLDPSVGHAFIEPCKRIHESQDVSAFLTSKAYVDLMTFILQLNRSMFPVKQTGADGPSVQTWPLNSDAVEFSAPVRQCQLLLSKLEAILEEAPPDTGPRRFGNVSFRKWFQIVESRADQLLEECLVPEVLGQKLAEGSTTTAKEELKAYFLGSWGSAQRLDYGTGHELSFLAFLGGMWKLNGFPKNEAGVEERAIVIGVIQPYLDLIRTIIRRYTLEPAGSHGVWGLDDHSFIPYILGAAQLAQPMVPGSETLPEEGSLPDAPDPGGVAKANIVERERKTNMYFAAVGFIYDVKRGPFWEHSPMLFDISGVRAGWAKINKGMLKMYNAEVLSKFPVVQHFPFGSLFSFDRDPNAVPPTQQPQSQPTQRPGPAQESRTTPGPGTTMPTGMPTGTAAPWATSARGPIASVPETTRFPAGSMPSTRAPGPGAGDGTPTKAPWAK